MRSVTYSNLATYLSSMRRYEEAAQYFESSIELIKKHYGENSDRLILTYTNYGTGLIELNQLEPGLELFN